LPTAGILGVVTDVNASAFRFDPLGVVQSGGLVGASAELKRCNFKNMVVDARGLELTRFISDEGA
jgi:hypothetical protein